MRTAASALEHIFTNPNPVNGKLPPTYVAWVIFENGTVFYAFPGPDLPATASAAEVTAAAAAAFDDLGPVVAGTPSADFSVNRLASWFPAEGVFFVTYGDPRLVSFVIEDAEATDFAVGLLGRSNREADFTDPRVAVVRTFDGGTTSG
jgi:hypothetical protein